MQLHRSVQRSGRSELAEPPRLSVFSAAFSPLPLVQARDKGIRLESKQAARAGANRWPPQYVPEETQIKLPSSF